jgi:hypothetical protein
MQILTDVIRNFTSSILTLVSFYHLSQLESDMLVAKISLLFSQIFIWTASLAYDEARVVSLHLYKM